MDISASEVLPGTAGLVAYGIVQMPFFAPQCNAKVRGVFTHDDVRPDVEAMQGIVKASAVGPETMAQAFACAIGCGRPVPLPAGTGPGQPRGRPPDSIRDAASSA